MSATTTEIRYHSRSRILELCFADGERVTVPAAWLRAQASAAARPEAAAGGVGIARIAPLAADCVRLHFDDGHDGAAVSFEELRALALRYREQAMRAPAAG